LFFRRIVEREDLAPMGKVAVVPAFHDTSKYIQILIRNVSCDAVERKMEMAKRGP
jgi:protoheme ferro-lyase